MRKRCTLIGVFLMVMFNSGLGAAQSDFPSNTVDSDNTIRGIVKAVHQAEISSDLPLPVTEIPYREGQSFNKGDLLIAFDCRDLKARLKSAKAQLKAEQLTRDNNQYLADRNAVGQFDVQLQITKLEQAGAEVESLTAQLSHCQLEAPFDGAVADIYINEHEVPDRQQPLLKIVNYTSLEIEVLLPAKWLTWLNVGTSFELNVEEIDKSYPATVVRMSPIVDPVSQTVKVIGRFSVATPNVFPGMSGPARF